MASTTDNAQTAEVRKGFWRTRYRECRAIVDRAIDRREVPEAIDARLLLEVFISPVHSRLLLTREAVDQDFLQRLADVAVKGRQLDCRTEREDSRR